MSELPSYGRPPVTEVVLAVAFAGVPALTIAHLGHFWFTELRAELPDIEEQAPYEPPIESMGAPAPPVLSFQFLGGLPSPRLWAKSPEGTRLLQMQRNWIAFNWRDAPASTEPYPRWQRVEEEFLRYFRQLRLFCDGQGLGTPVPIQCEVTYINSIRSGAGWSDHGDLHKVLSVLAPPHGFLDRPETTQFATAFRIRDNDANERGRLHVTAQPAFDVADNSPALVLTLVARGAPFSPTEEGLLSFLRLGHEWVVAGFTSVTTEPMQQEWERHA